MTMAESGMQSNQILPSFAPQENKQVERERNTKNKNNTEIYLDKEADIIRNYVSIHYIISKDERVEEKRYYSNTENLVACEEGYAIVRYEYDKQKCITYKRYFHEMMHHIMSMAIIR